MDNGNVDENGREMTADTNPSNATSQDANASTNNGEEKVLGEDVNKVGEQQDASTENTDASTENTDASAENEGQDSAEKQDDASVDTTKDEEILENEQNSQDVTPQNITSQNDGLEDTIPSYNAGAQVSEASSNSSGSEKKTNLKEVKKSSPQHRTRMQKLIIDSCGLDENTKLNKKRMAFWTMLNLAKLTVACTVFGPIVGGWLVAHYNDRAKGKDGFWGKKEQKVFNFINRLSWSDKIIGE